MQNVPPDLSQCVFVIEQALSVRALQEIISSNDAEAVSGQDGTIDLVCKALRDVYIHKPFCLFVSEIISAAANFVHIKPAQSC